MTAPLWPAALIAAAEPTYKFAANIRSIKYSRYQDIAKMGRRELARGAVFTAPLAVLYYRGPSSREGQISSDARH